MKQSVASFTALLVLLAAPSEKNGVAMAQSSSNMDCKLQCHGSAPCVFGIADFTEHPLGADGNPLEIHASTSQGGMHCSCPHGWTGLTCNRIFETCDGNHKCYNGGRCIPGLQDHFGNEQLFCDCSHATDEEGQRYVGKFCEHPSVDHCQSTPGSFCVNGGECDLSYPEKGNQCICEPGFVGEHCEFKQGSVPICDLECQNGGYCQLGINEPDQTHDLTHLFKNVEGYKTCVCPQGYGGSLCEIKKSDCGSHHCYHGGTCITREIEGVTQFHCDCTSAHSDDKSYAGRFCQFEATSFCSKSEDQNGQLFCVNGGTCLDNDLEGCNCPEGFAGPSCEYKLPPMNVPPTVAPTPPPAMEPTNPPAPIPLSVPEECKLQCLNGGKCRTGAKDLGIIKGFASTIEHLNKTFDNNFEHCICPVGFVGLKCEHEIQICPKGEHVCLHGSTCVTYGEESKCDCSSAQTDFASHFTGDHCEHGAHSASEFCTVGPLLPGKPRSFCVNGGVCKAKVTAEEEHPGCTCDAEYSGPHCEVLRKNIEAHQARPAVSEPLQRPPPPVPTSTEPMEQAAESGPSATFVFLFVFSLLVLLMGYPVIWYYCKRSEMSEKRAEQAAVQRTLAFSMPSSKYSDHPRGNGSNSNNNSFRLSNSNTSADEPVLNLAVGEGGGSPIQKGPFVNIGPPRDEDGHELHNVEIC